MNLRYEILKACAANPGAPVDEIADAIESALGPDGFRAYCRGTAIKYAWRAGKKGDASEDMAKGAWYLSRAANINKEQQQ